MGGQRQKLLQHLDGCCIGIQDRRTADRSGRAQGERRGARPADIDQNGVEAGEVGERQHFRIGLRLLVVEGGDDALAMRIDHDRGQRRTRAGNPADKAAVDAFGLDVGNQLVADRIVARACP